MQKYVEQLTADILAAQANVPAKPYYEAPPHMEGLEYIMEWENNPEKPMSEWFKLESCLFPPPEKLTDQQMQQLTDAILDLWAVFGFEALFPDELPVLYQYQQLVKVLDEDTQWSSEGVSTHWCWCNIDPETCPFPEEYCTCKDIEVDDMDSFEYDPDALPF